MSVDTDARPAPDEPDLYAADPTPAELVAAAIRGDKKAWLSLVQNYTPLLRRVVRRFRLPPNDADDVVQAVWLLLWQHLSRIREPAALPGWISTTARRESIRVINNNRRWTLTDPLDDSWVERGEMGPELLDELLRIERCQAVHNGLRELDPRHRELLLLLNAEPRFSYQEISRRLGMPVGSIGPTQARVLSKLRATSAVATLISSELGDGMLVSA